MSVNPEGMICGVVSLRIQSKLVGDIDISVLTHTPNLHQLGDITWIYLPRCSTIHALDSLAGLTLGPLLKTILVHVVATSGFAPDKFVMLFIEVHVADRAFAISRFALAVCVVRALAVCRQWRGIIEDLVEL